MRELTPDRPDKTESPYTVDARHFQLEMSFAEYIQSRNENVRTKAWNIAPVNLKAGLLNNMDLQFIFQDYFKVRSEDLTSGARSSHPDSATL